jgi:hypothetical protein
MSRSLVALPLALALVGLPTPALATPPEETAAPAVAPQPVPPPVYEQPATQPVYPQPLPPQPPNRNRGLGLLIAGTSVFGFSYLFTVVAGVVLIDSNNEDVGRPLLIPIAGPFIGISRSDSATAAFGLGFAGLAQLAGLGMSIGGGVMLGRSRRQAQLSFAPGGLQLRF